MMIKILTLVALWCGPVANSDSLLGMSRGDVNKCRAKMISCIETGKDLPEKVLMKCVKETKL